MSHGLEPPFSVGLKFKSIENYHSEPSHKVEALDQTSANNNHTIDLRLIRTRESPPCTSMLSENNSALIAMALQ